MTPHASSAIDPSTTCPDENDLLDVVAGRAHAARRAAIEAHARHCSACRRLLLVGAEDDSSPGVPATREHGLPALGARIDRYIVLRNLGAGGMGIVCEAYDPELDRKVALKLLRQPASERDSATASAQLLDEARSLARLAHPNVTSIHEIGEADGQLFFVMELVDGMTLRAWLAAEPRRWAEVLAVCTEAGRGLAAAHASGLVHRDFKPDNVLIGADGRVRVTDFGLARSIEAPIDADTDLDREELPVGTFSAAFAGTPAYMSPEQHRRQLADPASDQFGFCVSLYEALYGTRPFAGDTYGELRDSVLSGQIALEPSTPRIPRRLRNAIRRGLALDPADRFASMDALLVQLTAARARGRRWRRVATYAAWTAVLVAGASAWVRTPGSVADPCRETRAAADRVWTISRRAELKRAFTATGSGSASASWQRTEHAVDGWVRRWSSAMALSCKPRGVAASSEILDRASSCLDRRLDEMDALLTTLAKANPDVVARAAAAVIDLPGPELCTGAALFATQPAPPPAAIRVAVESAQHEVDRARAEHVAGRFREALATIEPAVGFATASGYAPLEAEALMQRGRILGDLNEPSRAVSDLEKATWRAMSVGLDRIAVDAVTRIIPDVGLDARALADGERWTRLAQSVIDRGHLGDETQSAADLAIGMLYTRAGQLDNAVAKLRTALSVTQRNRLAVPNAHVASSLAIAVQKQGHLDEAESLFGRALAVFRAELGDDHPTTITTLANLGALLNTAHRYAEAVEVHREVVDRRVATLGEDSVGVAFARNNLAIALVRLGHPDQAIGEYERAIGILERHPDQADRLAATLGNLSGLYGRIGKTSQSVGAARRALELEMKLQGDDHPETAAARLNYAETLQLSGDYRTALKEAEAARKVIGDKLGHEHEHYGMALALTGTARLALGQMAAARRDLVEARIVLARGGDPEARDEVDQALAKLGVARARSKPRTQR